MNDTKEREVSGEEEVCRFLFTGDYTKKNGVTFGAFFPIEHEGRLETSVCRIDSFNQDDTAILRWGDKYVAPLREREIRGRAELSVNAVRASELDVIPDEPPPLHAEILGWPPLITCPPEQSKNWQRKQSWQTMATKLKRAAITKLR